MNHTEILSWLLESDVERLEELWRRADETRKANVGDEVHLRGLIEFSNYCARQCAYCGLRAPNQKIVRYRMTQDDILECARKAVEFGYGTVVMQSGEDYGVTQEWMANVIRLIRRETPLAVTLSLGERSDEDMRVWREAGADRYLLRFETSNDTLYEKIHPSLPGKKSDRCAILRTLKSLGYEAGSGVMIGIPGQTYEDLVNDLLLFRELDLDMIGIGPYIPHPETPLGAPIDDLRLTIDDSSRADLESQTPSSKAMEKDSGIRSQGGKIADRPIKNRNRQSSIVNRQSSALICNPQSAIRNPQSQAPNTELMTYKMIALTRLICPWANIPSTTALATLNKATGRELGLSRGANIVMPNLTPPKYRVLYEIYPAKACINETAEQCQLCLEGRIHSLGRRVGSGPGGVRRAGKAPRGIRRI
ncbi:MAG: radical SAM protein [Candidatus Sumerlaeota bacterium]|nr:radical SAM protein [Candidatus Sumerlaeota bacterium]